MKKILFAIAATAMLVACGPKNGPGNDPEDWSDLNQPQNRLAVIEEYTGINCGYCPEGHKIVNNLVKKYPGRAFAVNIHQGTYAAGTYTTTEGNAYAREADIEGYPSGSVNRHLFKNYADGLAMNRGDFSAATKKILDMASPVNIAATASINKQTRELKVKVRGYYTADALDASDQPLEKNSLYVLLLQDSVMGQQSGASANPEQVIDGRYCHMHMLRASINGTWGEDIAPVTAGSHFVKEYTYTIPEKIGTDNVKAVLEHMKVLVFIAEGHKEIYTAAEPEIQFQ